MLSGRLSLMTQFFQWFYVTIANEIVTEIDTFLLDFKTENEKIFITKYMIDTLMIYHENNLFACAHSLRHIFFE